MSIFSILGEMLPSGQNLSKWAELSAMTGVQRESLSVGVSTSPESFIVHPSFVLLIIDPVTEFWEKGNEKQSEFFRYFGISHERVGIALQVSSTLQICLWYYY